MLIKLIYIHYVNVITWLLYICAYLPNFFSGRIVKVDVDYTTPGFYRTDGVHLSLVGIEMMLDKIRDELKDLSEV